MGLRLNRDSDYYLSANKRSPSLFILFYRVIVSVYLRNLCPNFILL